MFTVEFCCCENLACIGDNNWPLFAFFATTLYGRLKPNVAPCLCGLIIGIGITTESIILFPFDDDDDLRFECVE
ncbi:hypothetical protein DERP_011546 [Dermatophagoides pteronyssinus]|uniref:Uncharacterized protein n=1 Tax=Dermatophagoides pteronyssinus TaxID=6956 RepID=A0ABQ8JC94_DERPT|nr:hypothetical protein DERP_011546 [Dermatophagoides pteronyssinus]